MITGTAAACALTGFVPRHADAVVDVAKRLNTAILFREPGLAAQSLIADSYAMKGFRIDTKSCNWGPMRGFVCVDPRLSKANADGGSYAAKNEKWTHEALAGEIVEKFFGKVDAAESADWRADVMPIVISKARLDELAKGGHIQPQLHQGGGGAHYYSGVARQTFGGVAVALPWRLMPTRGATNRWLSGPVGAYSGDYYVLCIEPKQGFTQLLPADLAEPVLFRGYHTVLGMCNPGSKHLGFKACVTADYDLFAIWPHGGDAGDARHRLVAEIQAHASGAAAARLPMGVARMPGVDDRLQARNHREHFRYGDVSARVMQIKTMANTAIIAAGYQGGNAIHHNDEQGNMALAKGSLAECLPVLACVPWRSPGVIAVTSAADFAVLVKEGRTLGYDVRAKREWLQQANA